MINGDIFCLMILAQILLTTMMEIYIGGSILEYCVVEYAGGSSIENNGAGEDGQCPSLYQLLHHQE